MLMDEQTITTYNELGKEYDEETKDFWENFPRTVVDAFVTSVRGKVLDIGSGPGRDGLILKTAGLDVVCLDASEAMVKISREKGLESILGDFNDLPFVDNSFDGVWAYTSLLHVPKARIGRPLREIVRVLKPGGMLGLGLIEGESELYRESSGVGKPRWFSFYTKDEIEKFLARYNFRVEHFETFTPGTKNYLNFIARLD